MEKSMLTRALERKGLRNLDIVSSGLIVCPAAWIRKPVSTFISDRIQRTLEKSPAGNEEATNHTAIYLDGYVYEIHVNALNKIPVEEYFDTRHRYYGCRLRLLDRMKPNELDDCRVKAHQYLEYVFEHQKKRTDYDTWLIFRIAWHLRKRTLETMKSDLRDLDFICSELAQSVLEQSTGKTLRQRVMLPNDFHDRTLFDVRRLKV